MNKDDAIKNAVIGSNDYHEIMRSVAVYTMRERAGMIPPKMDNEPLPEKNPEHWQSRKLNMGVGMLWIFYAVEYGHFRTGEAKVIWRYGQALKFPRYFKHRFPKLGENQKLMGAIEYCVKNPANFCDDFGDIIHGVDDEFHQRDIHPLPLQMEDEIYQDSLGSIDIQSKTYRTIARLIDNLILWIYTGQEHLSAKDRKELYSFMGWH